MYREPDCPIVPVNDRVVIVGDQPAEMVGVLYMPENAKPAPQRGRVVAIGPGKWSDHTVGAEKMGDYQHPVAVRVPMTLKVGDVVWFGKYSGAVLEIGDGVKKKEYRVMREDEVLAVEP